MRTRARLVLVAAALLFVAPPGSVLADDDRIEVWDQTHLNGARAGTVHTISRAVQADGVARHETVVVSDMKMKRMGQTTEINTKVVTWEDAEGKLLRIATSQKMSAMTTDTVFTFKEGKVSIETTVMGNTRKAEQTYEGELLGPKGQEALIKPLCGTKDKSVTFLAYVPDFQRVVKTTVTSKGQETVELLGGKKAELTRVEATLEGLPITPITFLDDKAQPLKVVVNVMGMNFETYRVANREEAMSDAGTSKATAPEAFNQTLLIENDPIPVPRHLDAATIIVRKRKADTELPDMSGPGHVVEPQEDGSLRITAKRVEPPEGKQGTRPLTEVPDELADSLAASSMIQSDAEKLVKTAREVVGSETNAWRAAQKLEYWVFKYMTQKSMGVGFASALESFDTREGDCTEHAVLLAALGRAAGIPTRVVMGLVYLMGVWGGHAWNEVWIEGTWYPLDATNGYGFTDPLHLPMAHMTMKEGGASEFTTLIMGMGTMDVDIVSVVRDGRTIDVSKSPTLVTTKNGYYTNPIWGISLEIPAGWELDLPEKRKQLSPRLLELDGKTADGKKVEIKLDVMDAPPKVNENNVLAMLGIKSTEKGELDGRPSYGATVTRGNNTRMIIACVADKALYIFSLDRPQEQAERDVFLGVLQSVDFDVK